MSKPQDREELAEAAPRNGGAELSFGQQQIWFLDQLVPGNSFYNLTSTVRLTGILEVGALTRAVEEVVARHEVLSCRIGMEGGGPLQFPAASPVLQLLDLSSGRPGSRLFHTGDLARRGPTDVGVPWPSRPAGQGLRLPGRTGRAGE